ncbi:unnamed protein product [Effrenium voratum]|uniref:G-patch domain-containing protein n=1 Tax=Effrenium voratum TaxID=2562239 RepID=A0AA36NH81_9DINO|nr:unnamed protein product [Effrenium voratum]
MDIGKRMMEKWGWAKGQGLGKDNRGMTSCLVLRKDSGSTTQGRIESVAPTEEPALIQEAASLAAQSLLSSLGAELGVAMPDPPPPAQPPLPREQPPPEPPAEQPRKRKTRWDDGEAAVDAAIAAAAAAAQMQLVPQGSIPVAPSREPMFLGAPPAAPTSNPNFGVNASSTQKPRIPYMWPKHMDDWRWSKGFEATYCFEEVGLPHAMLEVARRILGQGSRFPTRVADASDCNVEVTAWGSLLVRPKGTGGDIEKAKKMLFEVLHPAAEALRSEAFMVEKDAPDSNPDAEAVGPRGLVAEDKDKELLANQKKRRIGLGAAEARARWTCPRWTLWWCLWPPWRRHDVHTEAHQRPADCHRRVPAAPGLLAAPPRRPEEVAPRAAAGADSPGDGGVGRLLRSLCAVGGDQAEAPRRGRAVHTAAHQAAGICRHQGPGEASDFHGACRGGRPAEAHLQAGGGQAHADGGGAAQGPRAREAHGEGTPGERCVADAHQVPERLQGRHRTSQHGTGLGPFHLPTRGGAAGHLREQFCGARRHRRASGLGKATGSEGGGEGGSQGGGEGGGEGEGGGQSQGGGEGRAAFGRGGAQEGVAQEGANFRLLAAPKRMKAAKGKAKPPTEAVTVEDLFAGLPLQGASAASAPAPLVDAFCDGITERQMQQCRGERGRHGDERFPPPHFPEPYKGEAEDRPAEDVEASAEGLAPVASPKGMERVRMEQISAGPVDFVARCVQGLFAGRFIYINRTPQGELFGSDRNSNAVTMYIENAGLSPSHAEIKFNGQTCQYFLRDAGSTDGTWVRIRWNRSVEIGPGQEIRIGDSLIEVRQGKEITEAEEVEQWLSTYQLQRFAPLLSEKGFGSLSSVRQRLLQELQSMLSAELSNEDYQSIEMAAKELDRTGTTALGGNFES